jgi:predicted dienelactone hydrolase
MLTALLAASATPAWAQCTTTAPNAGYNWISVPENPPPPLTQFQGGVMNIGIWYPTSTASSSYRYNSGNNVLNLALSGCAAFDGAVTPGVKYPVLLFSHADGGCGTQSVFLTEQAARMGYIVIAPDSTDATCSVTGVPYTNPTPSMSFVHPPQWTSQSEINRLYDMENALLAVYADPRYGPSLDLTHVAISGHSLGGYAAFGIVGGWSSWQSHWQTTMTNAGIGQAIPKVALLLSPFIQAYMYQLPNTVPQVTVPLMFQGATLDMQITPWVMGISPDVIDTGAFAQARAPKMFMELDMGTHTSFTNAVCVSLIVPRCLASVPNTDLIDNYAFAFLGYYLSNQAAPLLWSAPVPITSRNNLGPANWWRITPAITPALLPPGQTATVLGTGLASTTASDSTGPLTLGSVQVSLTDSLNVTHQAPLYFVSPTQVNYLVPGSTAVGAATIAVSDSSGAVTNSASAPFPGNPAIQGDIVATGAVTIQVP